MAEKKSRSERMYGKGPSIVDEPAEGDVNRSTNEQGAKDEVEKTAAKPETRADMKSGGNAKGDVMAGTDGIMTHHQHSAERTETHHRHMHEQHALHERHEREHMMRAMGHHHESHEEMNDRHHEERRKMHTRHEKEHRELGERHEESGEGPTAGIKEKPEGKGGTEEKT